MATTHKELTNIWCNNCKGYKYLSNECPTSNAHFVGNHLGDECWHLTKSRVVNQVAISHSQPWQQ